MVEEEEVKQVVFFIKVVELFMLVDF